MFSQNQPFADAPEAASNSIDGVKAMSIQHESLECRTCQNDEASRLFSIIAQLPRTLWSINEKESGIKAIPLSCRTPLNACVHDCVFDFAVLVWEVRRRVCSIQSTSSLTSNGFASISRPRSTAWESIVGWGEAAVRTIAGVCSNSVIWCK
jgi:hypothetical protein